MASLAIAESAARVRAKVFNRESWCNITKDNQTKLKEIDVLYWRKLFDVSCSVPKEGLYITTGTLPLKFMIIVRHMMYWWHIVNTDKKEILNKYYCMQVLSTDKNDWINQINQNKKDLCLKISDSDL